MSGKEHPVLSLLSTLETEVRFRLSGKKTSDLEPPVFIVGCGHSGTTLLLKIIGAHSRIFPIHYESGIAYHKGSSIAEFNKMCINAGKARWVEKTPRHINRIGTLLQLAPDARILVVLRDGRDVACSLRRRAGGLEAAIQRWVDANVAALPHLELDNVMPVNYEDIITDFEATMRDVMSFCGETFEPGQKNFHEYHLDFQAQHLKSKWITALYGGENTRKKHRRRRRNQIHQKLFDGRNIWKQELTDDDKRIVKNIAGELLQKLEYADDDRW